MKKCPLCGEDLPDDALFCNRCGTQISDNFGGQPEDSCGPAFEKTENLYRGDDSPVNSDDAGETERVIGGEQMDSGGSGGGAPVPPETSIKNPKPNKGFHFGRIFIIAEVVAILFVCFLIFRANSKNQIIGSTASGTAPGTKSGESSSLTSTSVQAASTATQGNDSNARGGASSAAVLPQDLSAASQSNASTADTSSAPAAVVTPKTITPTPVVHHYQVITQDCTWEQANQYAAAMGGYLVHFDTVNDFNTVVSQYLNTAQIQTMKLWIGGRRSLDSQEYHWVNADGTFDSKILNSSDYPGCWYTNEPSFRDTNLNIDESYMEIFFDDSSGKWVWNDVPNDIISAVPTYKGSVGYIVEFGQ